MALPHSLDLTIRASPPSSGSPPASTQDSIKNRIAPRLLCEFNARAKGSSSLVNHIAFSADGRAVVTYYEYIPIPSLDSPPMQHGDTSQTTRHSGNVASSHLSSYHVESDGWIWRSGSNGECRRVRWLPSIYRFTPAQSYEVRGGWDICGDRIALATNDGRLVVVDASDDQ